MNGTLWVDHLSERHQGWYPAKLGAGAPGASCWPTCRLPQGLRAACCKLAASCAAQSACGGHAEASAVQGRLRPRARFRTQSWPSWTCFGTTLARYPHCGSVPAIGVHSSCCQTAFRRGALPACVAAALLAGAPAERHEWRPVGQGCTGLRPWTESVLPSTSARPTQEAHCTQVPDLDAVLQTSDFPCMLAADADDAPPVFGYNSHPTFTDVPFPDYSYWGHEYSHLRGAPRSLAGGCRAAAPRMLHSCL